MAKKNTIRNIKKIYSNDNMSYLLINLLKSILSIFIQKISAAAAGKSPLSDV